MSLSSSLFSTTILLSFSLLIVFPCVTCFDITKLLSQFPTYSTFSNYLTQTNLAADINNRNSITVLAVDNSGMAPVSGKSMDVIKNVLSLHVILDYYDVQKLQHLQNKSITVRTLFDTSGKAHGLQGFLKITDLNTNAVSFVSAFDTNDSIGCNLIKSLVSQPYNISVVHVSTVIMPPFLLANSNAPALAPVTVTVPVPMPVASEPIISVTPVPMPVLSPMPTVVPVPVPVTISVPVVSPVPVPVPVLAPVLVVSPVPVPVMTPSARGEPTPADAAADAPPPEKNNKSGAGILKFGGVNGALTLALTFFSMCVLSRSIISYDS